MYNEHPQTESQRLHNAATILRIIAGDLARAIEAGNLGAVSNLVIHMQDCCVKVQACLTREESVL